MILEDQGGIERRSERGARFRDYYTLYKRCLILTISLLTLSVELHLDLSGLVGKSSQLILKPAYELAPFPRPRPAIE